MSDELIKVGIVAEDKTGAGVASAKRNLDSLSKGASSAATNFNTLKTAAVGAGAAFAAIGVANVAQGLAGMAAGALKSYAEFERLGQSLNALTAKQALLNGSASTMTQAMAQTSKQSKELLSWVQKLAIESPFTQDDVARAFRLSMALGFSTKEAQRLTQAMLNFATATGAEGQTIEQINRALGQMRTKGKVSMEEINQLTEAGVDAMRILKDATGKSGEALSKDIAKGAIDADTAINAIIGDTERLYAGAGKAASTGMSGMMSTLAEAQDTIGRTLFTGVFEQLAGPMAALTSIVTAPEFTAGLEQWSATLGSFTGDRLEAAAAAMERIDAAISPLLDTETPLWLVALQKIAEAGGLPPIELKTNITPENQAIIDKLIAANEKGGLKGLGDELAKQSRAELVSEASQVGDLAVSWATTIKSNLDAEFSTWQPVIGAVGAWVGDTPNKLFEQAQAPFKEPIMLAGSWVNDTFSGLWSKVQGWFTANPITLNVKTSYTPTTQPAGLPPGTALPIDVTAPMPEYVPWNSPRTSSTGGPAPKRKRAIGDGFFAGGLALVGEQGPELTLMPRGTTIYSNRDTRAMYGGSVPHFAAGTTQIPPAISRLLGAMGLWVPQQQAMGPQTQQQALAWKDFTQQGTAAMQAAANQTGQAFENTAAKVNKAFEGALSSVPGLFGTSQVTGEDMRKSQLGIYQPKADEYLRQLSDEVLNGKDWGAGVDIKDAAKRAGIDPNLPNDIILELVKEAWNNSSLFAEGKNLDLINTDAVKAAIEQQQKELSGQASLKALFGITDENLQQQSEQLGQGLAAVFGGAAETDAVKAAGSMLFAGVSKGLSDTTGAAQGVAGMADAMKTAIGTPENQQALYDNGYAAYAPWSKGFAAAAAAAPIVPPGGGTTPPGTTPPGKAVGVGFWPGGWMTVHANETIYAPRGTTVRNAREGAGAGTIVNNFNTTVIRQIDEEALMARIARRVRQAR